MKRVFVSYSRTNLDAVTQLVDDMKNVGIDIWHDRALTGGQRWWDDILANIRECDIFIFALSPESWDSEACRSELGYVVQLGKPIVPVLVSDGINLNLLSPPLDEIHVTDYKLRDKGAAFAVVKALNMAPSAPDLPDPLPTPPRVPISYLSTLRDRIDSSDPLSSQVQITLFFELEQELQDGRSPTETRDLLRRLRRRDDLLAKIASKIDAALKADGGTRVAPEPIVIAAGARTSTASEYQPQRSSNGCPQCHTQVEASWTFCGKCGTNLAVPGVHPPPAEGASTSPNTKSRRYMCPPADVAQLVTDVRDWLNGQGFDSQQMTTEKQGLLLQIKKRGGWRDYVGMGTSLNILFRPAIDTLAVEIGAGKWIDKAAVGTVSMFIPILAFTAGYGAWEQMQLPERVFGYISSRLISR